MAVSGQDIGLLFGVLGGGRISGESGALIKSQLDSIVASLNNATNSKQRRIKLNLDVAGTKSSFSTGLKQITNGLSGQKQFKIKVSEIDATSAINKLKSQLDAMLRTIKVDTGFTVTLGKNGASSAMKEIANDAKGAVLSIAEAEAALKEISITNQSLTAGYKKAKEALGGEAATGDNIAALEQLKQKYLELQTAVSTLSTNKKQLSQDEVNQIYIIQAALQQLIAQTMQRVAAENAVADAANKRAAAEAAAAEREKAASLDVIAMRKEAIALQKRMTSALNNFSKASGTPWYQTISAGKAELDAMLNGTVALDRTRLNKLIDSFNESEGAIRGAGLAAKSFGDSIVANAKKFTQWFGVSQIIMRIVSLLGDMVGAVKDVDSAMTELRKVTNETETTYTRFLENAAKRAKTLGATLSDTITASADFARLGFSIDEAAELADAALVYKNVGDGIEDISTASESIISTMQAFGVEAEQSMFIVDKFNEVGNNFAISSKGVGDALLRSASALAAGNNTLDESIGLITAANTVVQDADVVGTTMKTISMYLRAAKTEAEEAGESTDGMAKSVSELREEILSLTGGKVDIQIDENTFKSTYQIIKELSEVWGGLTDITQANILEMIGGKRNSNVVSALLNNFALAEDVVKTSAEAAGSALAENEKYIDSIEGRISIFSATFEEMSTSVIDSELVKTVIDLGTALVSVIGSLAKVDALLPSVVAMCVTIKSFKMAQSLAQLAAQEEAASASLVSRLLVEKSTNDSLIVSYQTLSAAQQKNVLEKLQAAVASGALSQAEYELIAKNLALAVSTEGAATATTKLNVSIKGLLASNPVGWIMLAISLIPTVISLIGKLHKSTDELKEEYDDLATEVDGFNDELETNKERIRELQDLSNNGTITLVEQEELDKLLQTNSELERELRLKKELAAEAAQETNESLVRDFNRQSYSSTSGLNTLIDAGALYEQNQDLIRVYEEVVNGWSENWDKLTEAEQNKAIDLYSQYQNMIYEGNNAQMYPDSLGFDEYVRELIDRYNELSELGETVTDDQLWQMASVRSELVSLGNVLQDDYIGKYVGNGEDVENWNRLADAIDACINPAEHFTSLLNELPDDIHEVLTNEGSDGSLSAERVSELASQYTELSNWMAESGYTAEDVAKHYNALAVAEDNAENATSTYTASLHDLSETLSDLQDAYDILADAQEEMSGGGGLSVDTIESLAKAEENYLDYLYEENGVIKLNTEAWKENANAKMSGDIAEIQKEIAALQEERASLQADLAEYEANRQLGNDGGIWSSLIAETTTKLEENSAAILENQGLLALYTSIYGDIIGELDAYSAALNNFANIANTIDTVSDSFATLANLQAEVADGFTISLEKALEFASVYPEILNSATVTSDGQIALNEGVVNSFITGKKAELDAQVDAEIAKLEADKAVLTAKMQSAQAQLELAKNVGEGEGQISKELAEYRINAGNAVAEAMIAAGIDEATAFKLAALAMSQNAEEFNRVAAEVCTDVNGNFNSAAYNLAQTMYNNLTNVKTDLASVARQAHQTAKAIAGVADGTVAGSEVVQGGSGGGTGGSPIKINLTSGSFEGTDYTYEAKESNLDDFIADLELDISSYESAIAQIDGQIATLQALKNLPLKSFVSDTGGGGSGSGSTDEVEEYIADIEKYREALERLNDVRIKKADLKLELENAEDLDEQIRIEKELLGVYRAEQECLEEINGLRDETIANGVKTLEQLGFQIDYDPDNNKFFVKNLEHLNDLTADSVGKYGSMQEATNALRKDTEGLIDTLEELNTENQEDQDTWQELYHTIREAKINIVNNLKEIVSQASEAVDEIQNVYDTLKDAADEYAANGGFISVDAFQAIVDLGPEYMQYLRDENGLLVINEEAINRVIAAKTEQLALESAMSYIERLRLALQTESIEDLNTLLYATVESTNATWGLVYANLALLDLNSDQYQAALHNINAIRALADNAIQGIGRTAGTVEENLTEMKQGLDDILKYVMDMLRHRIEQQIDALEEMKDAYGELIELKKESMEATKEETDYQDEVAEKIKQIAKLQERINALSLDDSRDAQAQKAQLQEEMAELQKELADTQADYAYDTQQDSLDKMQEAYEAEKDKEIEILEESISSEQKLYEMAISYIQSNWDTLYQELIAWNTEYGSVLNSEITTAWDNCLAAAQRYGSYVSALNNIDADIESAGGGGNNITVGNTNYDSSSSKEESIEAIINEMWRNSRAHHSASTEQKAYLNKRNLTLGAMLAQYGITAIRGDDGVWYIDRVGGQQLYDKYKKYCYHQGGIVGDEGTLKENEVLAKLERGEVMISNRNKGTLFSLIEFVDMLSKKLDVASMGTMERPFIKDAKPDLSNITNNQSETIHFGDVYIYGADEKTVEKHREVTREFTNEVLKQLNIKR